MFAGKAPTSSADLTVREDHEFIVPVKGIRAPEDMELWTKSEAYLECLGFILAINDAIRGKSNNRKDIHLSPAILNLLDLLEKLDKLINDTPPMKQPQRYGNQAFREWYQKLKDQAFDLVQSVVPEKLHRAVPEIMFYLIESFGNSTRIDYGTGHELSFLMFLCCLFKIGVLLEYDKVAVACKVFAKYMIVVRKLQQTYRMEPAGSHGVWSLDDYQFVPFIWGSSQLIANPRIEPPMFLDDNIIDMYHQDYLFLACIKYINQVKTGPFAEHSNQLWGISGVANWSKINSGLIKMYKVEVLGKFPVAQHILFGSLLPLRLPQSNKTIQKTRLNNISPSPSPSNRSVTEEGSNIKDSQLKNNLEL